MLRKRNPEIAVLSDIHSNHIALEACLEYVENKKIDQLIFLGDYVSNCAYPEKTMNLIYKLAREKECRFIRGNREEMLIAHADGANDGWTIPSMSSGAILYTYNCLKREDIDFFKSLKNRDILEFLEYPSIGFCHGNMESATGFMEERNAEKYFELYAVPLILCGHTHDSGCWKYPSGKVINVGSVGTPLNAKGEAEFVILHGRSGQWEEEFVSVPFDRKMVVREIEESGLLEQSKLFGYLIRDLLLTGHDRWMDVIKLAEELGEKETGDAACGDSCSFVPTESG